MKNMKSFENRKKCTLIKHFIKELILKIGPAFFGNPWKSRKLGFLRNSMEIYENQRTLMNIK